MSYVLTPGVCQLPSSGLQRSYTCCIVMRDMFLTGSASGELCIFSINNRVFRAALPIANNGIVSMVTDQKFLYVGSGDGRIKKLEGYDTQ